VVTVTGPTKPRPYPTPTTRPFWEALAEGHVLLQRCNACGAWNHYPRYRCVACLSDDLGWEEVSGEGTIFTFTIARTPVTPHFADEVPQLLAIVELDEGPHLSSVIVDAAPDDLAVGRRVVPVFEHGDDGITLLKHRLV
jgi:uncharacterized OB-fold protein